MTSPLPHGWRGTISRPRDASACMSVDRIRPILHFDPDFVPRVMLHGRNDALLGHNALRLSGVHKSRLFTNRKSLDADA